MSDPFSTAAGAIQVADFALRSARQIYALIGDVKSAPEDIQQLWAVLGETADLMQHIVSYMREWQDQSRLNQDHRHLPPSLETAITWFADDMKQLRNCLPPTPEISFASKVKFVFRERDVKKITVRLQERKGSMNTMLSTIGRRNDLVLQHGVKTIASSVDVVRQQQTATLTAVHDAVSQVDQLRQATASQHSTIVRRLQALEVSATSPATTSRPSLSLATDDVPDDLHLMSRIVRAEIKGALEPFADTIAGRLDSVVDSTATEVLRKLQEITDEEGTDKEPWAYTSPVATVLGEAELRTRGDSPVPRPSSPVPMVGQQPAEIQLSRTYHWHGSMFGGVGVYVSKFRRRTSYVTRSPETYFQIRVDFLPARWITSYGISATYSTAPDVFGYYEICPRILPYRVLSFKSKAYGLIVHDDVSGFKRMISKGEINWFDQFFAGHCATFLEVAILAKSPKICRFLLCDLLIDVSCLFAGVENLVYLASVCVPSRYRKPHRVLGMAEIYLLLKDHLPEASWDVMRTTSLNHARLVDPGLKVDDCLELAEAAEDGCESLWAFPWYEVCIPLWLPMSHSLSEEKWLLDLFLARDGDPNLRSPSGQGLPLQAALDITTCCLPKRWPLMEGFVMQQLSNLIKAPPGAQSIYWRGNPRFTVGCIRWYTRSIIVKVGEEGSEEGSVLDLFRRIFDSDRPDAAPSITNESTMTMATTLNLAADLFETILRDLGHEEGPESYITDPSERDGADPLLLLVPLLESGADVHAIVMEGFGISQCSLTDYARDLGLEGIWNRALERCGYNPGAVEAESNRRLAHARRLKEGNASGIDASSLELPEVSGLRRRRTGVRDQTA